MRALNRRYGSTSGGDSGDNRDRLACCTDDREPGPCGALPERSVESGEVANFGFGAYQDRGDFAFGHLCLTAPGPLREFVGWKASLGTQDIPLVARQRDCSLSR